MGPVKTVEVPQDILDTAQLTIDDLKVEMAVYLYAQGRLSIGKAACPVGRPESWRRCRCGSFGSYWPPVGSPRTTAWLIWMRTSPHCVPSAGYGRRQQHLTPYQSGCHR